MAEGLFHHHHDHEREIEEQVEELVEEEAYDSGRIEQLLGEVLRRLRHVEEQLDQPIHPPRRRIILATSLLDDGSLQANYVLVVDDKEGNIAQLVAPDAWAIDDTTNFTLTTAADGMSGTVTVNPSVGNVGVTGTLTVTVPTSADGSTDPLVETDTIVIQAGSPASATLTATVVPVTPPSPTP